MITYLHANSKNRSNNNSTSLLHHEESPSTSAELNDCQSRGASLGAVGCLKYVEDFEILETLGQGFFGIVYKVREKRNADYKSKNSVMVMKVPIVNHTQTNLCGKKMVSREYYMLRLLRHPNILRTRGVCIQQNGLEWNLRLLVDYCDGGSVQEATSHFIGWSVKGWLTVIAVAFIHRDLTASNILLQKSSNSPWRKAVVGDFGLSCRTPKSTEIKAQVGTQQYMAPEILLELFYNHKADIFSFGIIVCQMIARIDADHDAGLFRTSKFGLDYVRFAAHCPSDAPLKFLKTAFMCCLLAPSSRPSFEDLVEDIQRIINEDFSKGQDSFDDSRLGRSHSDATIRNCKSLSITTLNGRKSYRPDQLIIPEGVSIDENCSNENFAGTPSDNELDEQIKLLAASVAEGDPDYQISTLNPFASHHRYRSVRKIKPGDRYFDQRENCIRSLNEKKLINESLDPNEELPDFLHKKTRSRRSVSLPALFLTSPTPKTSRSPLAKASKRSITLGLGEQRELQSHMVATFKKIDQNFTNINRSGILLSSNDLSRLSNESLDKSILPNESEDEENSSMSDNVSMSDFPSKGPIEEDNFVYHPNTQMSISTSFDTTNRSSLKRGNSRRFFRKPSDECCIL
ncbi:Protein kinase domain-containing protein [Aphelenchoides bicaudatus]|nr:Protein kinase domain-containing protein [Aphelenchoides bicaudatus]